MKKSILILVLVSLMVLGFTITAFASKPDSTLAGYFDNFIRGDPDNPTVYCVHSDDGFLTGCVNQPYSPGLAAHGTFTGTVGGLSATCEYNIRTFDLDGIARIVMNRCTGDLAGFHMKGVGWMTGRWEGSYHFSP